MDNGYARMWKTHNRGMNGGAIVFWSSLEQEGLEGLGRTLVHKYDVGGVSWSTLFFKELPFFPSNIRYIRVTYRCLASGDYRTTPRRIRLIRSYDSTKMKETQNETNKWHDTCNWLNQHFKTKISLKTYEILRFDKAYVRGEMDSNFSFLIKQTKICRDT